MCSGVHCRSDVRGKRWWCSELTTAAATHKALPAGVMAPLVHSDDAKSVAAASFI